MASEKKCVVCGYPLPKITDGDAYEGVCETCMEIAEAASDDPVGYIEDMVADDCW